ncbi:hypothetical protein SLEP1_g474 [Rubroshorea leprosula]|uniref:Uncharacterized protein n=1 Tax=Rubroshorea leprosula TaxID=152421 RepID=A0AAV5HJK4_9ROSI|nr:hypothetical protein SLEP1_g474 [Rubroshorea leprosula]
MDNFPLSKKQSPDQSVAQYPAARRLGVCLGEDLDQVVEEESRQVAAVALVGLECRDHVAAGAGGPGEIPVALSPAGSISGVLVGLGTSGGTEGG